MKKERGMFKNGSRHYKQIAVIGSQYALDMPPDIRKSASYVAIFLEVSNVEREKLYKNYGGAAGSFENFNKLMDDVCGDYTCLIFKNRTQSTNLEDNIFWFKGDDLSGTKFKLGCNEYRAHGDARYNTSYDDTKDLTN